MRLIDADKVSGVLRELDTHSFSGTIHIKNAMYLINEQPTVYDVGKVVEQLNSAKKYNLDLADTMLDIQANGTTRHFICLEDAIGIVKAGGKNDN